MFRHCLRALALLTFLLSVCALLPLTGAVKAQMPGHKRVGFLPYVLPGSARPFNALGNTLGTVGNAGIGGVQGVGGVQGIGGGIQGIGGGIQGIGGGIQGIGGGGLGGLGGGGLGGL